MNRDYKWIFPGGSKKNVGINNTIETFKDHPISSLGREICQNSGDARRIQNEPVFVEFQTFKMKTADFPDVDEFRYAINKCVDFWKVQNNPKADKFFAKAKKTIDAEELTVLRISDHNTSGLDGYDRPDDTTAHWTSLVLSSGTSSKDGMEGGSFGIGKFAAFANSSLRTVFYSTVDEKKNQASQGISYLASFYDRDNQKTFGEGYCGDETKPIPHQIELDKNFRRTQSDVGTDIYICGFNGGPGWESKLIAAVLDGFVYAIDQNMLVVKVGNVRIDQKSLNDLIEKYKGICQKETYDYYNVLRSEGEWISLDDYDGEKESFRVKFIVKAGLNRRVAMVRRTGMKIYDQKGFNSNIMFAGFMYICGKNANKYLTSLENPQHTGWFVERDENDPEHAKNYLADIRRKLREELNKLIDASFGGEVIPEMGNLLQSIKAVTGGSEESEVVSDEPDEITPRVNSVQNPVTVSPDEETGDVGTEGGDEGGKDSGENPNNEDGPGYGNGENGTGNNGQGNDGNGGETPGGNKKAKTKGIALLTSRPIAVNVVEGRYALKLKPVSSSENASVDIRISAEDGAYAPDITSVTIDGQKDIYLEKGVIRGVRLEEKKMITIHLTIASTDYTSFEVSCYETKTE